MDTQVLLLCVPLVVAAVALGAGMIAREDITREGLTDASDDAARDWEGLFKRREGNRLKDYTGKVDDYVRQLRDEAKKRGLRTDGYVMDRVETICKALDPTNRIRKAPSLSDLRELSQQREQSIFSANLFRSLIPSILVLGIGCTLFGVHDVLSHSNAGDQLMRLLGEALLPGALAVMGTIILFFLRGVYNKEYAALIRALDRLTLHLLLPYFQEPDPTLHSLNEYVRQLNASVGGNTGQQNVNLKEGIQTLNGALVQWNERANDCMETLTHAVERINFIGHAARDIQEKNGKHFEKIGEMSKDMQLRSSNRSQNAQTLLAQTYHALHSFCKVLQTVSEKVNGRDQSKQRLVEQKKRLDEKLPEMEEGQAVLRSDAQNCIQLIQWAQMLSSLAGKWEKETSAGILLLLSHLTEHQNTMTSRMVSLPESSESYVEQMRQAAQENAVKMFQWLNRINERTRAYEKVIREQNERCRDIISGPLYPSGRWGIYMRVADTFCRVKWWFYAIVFVFILIYA